MPDKFGIQCKKKFLLEVQGVFIIRYVQFIELRQLRLGSGILIFRIDLDLHIIDFRVLRKPVTGLQ